MNGRDFKLATNKAHQAGLSAGRGLEVILFEAVGEVSCRENPPLLGFAVNSKVRNGAGRCRGWLAKHSGFRAGGGASRQLQHVMARMQIIAVGHFIARVELCLMIGTFASIED